MRRHRLPGELRNSGESYRLRPPAPRPGTPGDAALIARGRSGWENGLPSSQVAGCSAGHGAGAEGDGIFPRLAGQREAYLLKALRDFKSGARRGGGVAAMPDAVYPLSDAGLQALAHYLSRLRLR